MPRVDSTATFDAAPAFRRMFRPGRLTIGAVLPAAEREPDSQTARSREAFVRRAEALGFAALWCCDAASSEPGLAHLRRSLDAWRQLQWLAARTRTIALASGAPLHNAMDVVAAAAALDRRSASRLVLGLAATDPLLEPRASEVELARRAAWFRERFEIVRRALDQRFPPAGRRADTAADDADEAPRPLGGLTLLVTGESAQPLRWIAERADGWITFPRSVERQALAVARWQAELDAVARGCFKPFAQSLCVDLADKPSLEPTAIPLGFRSGRHFLLRFLESLRLVGVNHVVLNVHHGARPAGEALEEIGAEVLPSLTAAQGGEAIDVTQDAGDFEDAIPARH